MERLGDIGEESLVRRLVAGLEKAGQGGDGYLVVGPGDDCAVLDVGLENEYQILKIDSLVEGVHYLSDTPAEKVGWKAVARVISDFAAMGGRSGHFLVSIAMPLDKKVRYVEELYRGIQQCAGAYGAIICGGETSSVPTGSASVISVAGTGWVKKKTYVTRSGGKAADRILVTGKLGGSIRGKHLSFLPRLHEAQWLTAGFKISAMMDISDGLAHDLPRLAGASGCGFKLDEKSIPRNPGCDLSSALGDGEDYELLLTVPKEEVDELMAGWRETFPTLILTDIGELTSEILLSGDIQGGWQHFKA